MTSLESTTDPRLKLGIIANALLSAFTGILLLTTGPAVADLLGFEIGGWLRLFGVSLIGHALLLHWVRQQGFQRRWLRLNLALIAPYPLLLAALAFLVVDPTAGKLLLLADGALVGIIAALQYVGLRGHGDVAPIQPISA